MKVSFVIPAKDEEGNLPRTIGDIVTHTPAGLEYEVIVVDHGSQDATAEIARASGAMLVPAEHVTLGELRNVGARASTGEVLVFLDADVSLTPEWGDRFRSLLPGLVQGPPVLTGSWCEVNPGDSWIDWVWELGQHRSGEVPALGGAHMIAAKSTFWSIGGFPSALHGGEDEGLCAAAWAAGVPVVSDQRLRVVHRGVAKDLKAFFRRHRWHAAAEVRSVRDTRCRPSRNMGAAGSFALAHFAVLAAVLLSGIGVRVPVPVVLGAGAIILGLPLAKARRAWTAGGLRGWVLLVALYYVYYHARVAGVIATGYRPGGLRARRS